MSTPDRLLREYIQTVLLEDGQGGDSSGGDHSGYTAHDIISTGMDMNPYGMQYGSSDGLYKAFIKPFVDVAQTAAGKTKEMSVRTQTLIQTAFEAVATTLIPVLRDDYKQIFDHEHAEIKKIRQEYGDVYQSNWDALLNDDVLVAAFFYQPAAFFTVALARKVPDVLLSMAATLSGGQLDKWVNKAKEHVKKHGTRKDHGKTDGHSEYESWGNRQDHHKKGELGRVGMGVDYYEGVVREGADEPDDLTKKLTSEKMKTIIQGSSVTKKMEQSARAAVRASLQDVFKQAQGVLKASTLEQLQHSTGAKLKGMDKISQVPQAERQKAEQSILSTTKQSMKLFYVKNLEDQVKAAIAAGVPEDSLYVIDFNSTISKIKAL